MTKLPTAEQLKRLPLRAVAAFAARAARRVARELRGAIDEELMERALSSIESVASSERLDRLDAASACLLGSRLAGAAAALKTPKQRLSALPVLSGIRAAYAVLQSAAEPERAEYYAAYAARAAERAARAADVLDEPVALAATNAAGADYEMLLRTYGENSAVVLGEPVDLSDRPLLETLV